MGGIWEKLWGSILTGIVWQTLIHWVKETVIHGVWVQRPRQPRSFRREEVWKIVKNYILTQAVYKGNIKGSTSGIPSPIRMAVFHETSRPLPWLLQNTRESGGAQIPKVGLCEEPSWWVKNKFITSASQQTY